jgi:hypothetical protein
LQVLGQAGVRLPKARTYPAPEEGTLNLVYHPLEDGWVGFAEDARGTVAVRLGPIDPRADKSILTSKLLSPFQASIDRARHVRVMPFGALRVIDFHALPWDGAPLLEKRLVDYPLDLPGLATARALLVIDPTGDLPAAIAEGAVVDKALSASGDWTIDTLRGRDATSHAVLQRLSAATIFHYAGHGAFAGAEGWESTLRLANDSHVTIGDVLTLAHAPRIVVLSACEGARTTTSSAPEGLGLAQAFIAAGAGGVVAPVREIPDPLAAELTRLLYAQSIDGDPARLASAFMIAVRAIRANAPDTDWAAFRVLTP